MERRRRKRPPPPWAGGKRALGAKRKLGRREDSRQHGAHQGRCNAAAIALDTHFRAQVQSICEIGGERAVTEVLAYVASETGQPHLVRRSVAESAVLLAETSRRARS